MVLAMDKFMSIIKLFYESQPVIIFNKNMRKLYLWDRTAKTHKVNREVKRFEEYSSVFDQRHSHQGLSGPAEVMSMLEM